MMIKLELHKINLKKLMSTIKLLFLENKINLNMKTPSKNLNQTKGWSRMMNKKNNFSPKKKSSISSLLQTKSQN